MSITESEAKLKVMVMNSNALDADRLDTIADLTNAGLPQEIITRLNDLWEKTMEIGGQVINIGRVVLTEIMKFIKENPNLATGIALGAAVGALSSLVPLIGPFLAPLITAISISIGSIAGYRLDQGKHAKDGVIAVSQELISMAKKFFEFFANVFNALKHEFA